MRETNFVLTSTTQSGDFRSEFARELDLRLLPQGILLPINPNLAADFTFTPAAPKVLEVVTFDASTSTNMMHKHSLR